MGAHTQAKGANSLHLSSLDLGAKVPLQLGIQNSIWGTKRSILQALPVTLSQDKYVKYVSNAGFGSIYVQPLATNLDGLETTSPSLQEIIRDIARTRAGMGWVVLLIYPNLYRTTLFPIKMTTPCSQRHHRVSGWAVILHLSICRILPCASLFESSRNIYYSNRKGISSE